MSTKKMSTWAALAGRAVLVAFFTAIAVMDAMTTRGAWTAGAIILSVTVCAVTLLVPQLRWPAAPIVITVLTAWWGSLTVTLMAVVMFDLAATRRLRPAAACAAAALAANLLGYPPDRLWADQSYLTAIIVWTFALVLGLWSGNRRRLLHALAADVEHLRVEAQLREDTARIAERSRIAAEMHDVLAHRLSLIALHTGVLATKNDALPQPVVERLALLRTTSTQALGDLRDVLGALRGPDPTQTGTELRPILREVQELVDEARRAGQRIGMTTEGDPEQAPTTHRLAVYRIVQEALTNARKHADGALVTVRIDYRPPATWVEVTNTPGTSGSAGEVDSGYGLVGLRERVTALGGHLSTGPAGAGTWRLSARIPQPVDQQENGTPA
ncbi:sensor histidine kinase [Streptomyces rubiginosohelvolus]|uniref:sensor histidine kinase n=1 Tax=Streptomyces rubiginosohelvolus TaxID=67362 RepID=UPI0038293AE0